MFGHSRIGGRGLLESQLNRNRFMSNRVVRALAWPSERPAAFRSSFGGRLLARLSGCFAIRFCARGRNEKGPGRLPGALSRRLSETDQR